MKVCILGDARSIHLKRLARGLVDLGARVHVVTHKPDEIPGVTVERFCIPGPSLTNPRRWNGRRLANLRHIVRGFDVVSIQFLADWGLTPELIEAGCVIASPWGSDVIPPPGEGTPTESLTEARVQLIRRAAGVSTWGPSFARVVADYVDIEAERIDILPLGVDLKLFDPHRFGRADAKTHTSSATVGFYKGFRAVYGPTVLIRAMPLVRRAVSDVRFELVGDGAQLVECQVLAQELGVSDAINWLPRCPHGSVPNLLARWTVSAIPSIHEAFGVAALESSAMGVPVVASDVCGLQDTVRHDETGLLVPVGDHQALASALIELLTDAPRLERLSERGRAFVAQHFEHRSNLRAWIQYFERIREQRCVMV